MKITAILAAAASILATTVSAHADGYFGLGYNAATVNSTDYETWQGEAAIGFSRGNWGFQFDAGFGDAEADNPVADAEFWSLAGHVYWEGEGWRLGATALTTQFDPAVGDFDETAYGIEGLFDLGSKTVFVASATVGEIDAPVFFDIDTWNADLIARHYFGPNTRVSVTVGAGNIKGGLLDADTFSAGVGGEIRPWSFPVSLSAAYSHFEAESTTDTDVDSFSIGARWNFGGGSLRDRDDDTPFDTRNGFAQRVYDVR
jgi:hypothetical protein